MLTYWVIAIIVFLLLNTFVFPNLFRRQVEQTDYSTFLQMIEEKNIGEVSVEDTQITFSWKVRTEKSTLAGITLIRWLPD